MNLFELTNTEAHPLYQDLEISNGNRQYDFLRSIVSTAVGTGRTFLSQSIIKALNYHAIACLHSHAGEFRPCPVEVGVGDEAYIPPAHHRVQSMMDDFVNTVNFNWLRMDAVLLASIVLWQLNHIHPFINGNGRTARAACYYVLCVKSGGWILGEPILPELIKRSREEYVAALKSVDRTLTTGAFDLAPLHSLLSRLLAEQMASVPSPPEPSQPS